MRISCVIFDMDGTVLNTLDDLYTASCTTLQHYGFAAPTKEEVRQALGTGAKNLIHTLISHNTRVHAHETPYAQDVCTQNSHVSDSDEQALEADVLGEFLRIYAAHHLDTTRPYPHIPELLRELEKHEIKCALLSNKPDHDVQELVKRYFPDTFSYASGSVDSYPLKPAPEHAHAILSTLSCPCEEALYVGDSEVDIETAKRSGMHMAIVSWGFRDKDVLRARGASHIFDTPRELERYILNHSEK